MDQTKLESKIEATVNIASGFVLSYCVWHAVIYIYGGKAHVPDPFLLTAIFTVTSYIRSYYWRRFFATNIHKAIHKFVKDIICKKGRCEVATPTDKVGRFYFYESTNYSGLYFLKSNPYGDEVRKMLIGNKDDVSDLALLLDAAERKVNNV